MMTHEHFIMKTDDELVDYDEADNLAKLTAAMAHEVRNPLTTIKGFLQLLKPHLKEIDKEEYALIALNEIERVNEILYDFLTIAKPSYHNKTLSCVDDLIIYIVKLYECESIMKNVNIITHLSCENVLVNMNKNEIKQVLINLIKNGFEAIENHRSSGGQIEINTEISGEKIYIHIIDNGCGMSSETVDHLFTPFYSTKLKGTGMGLPICYKIIRKHLGRISVSTTENGGTKFTIEFPIDPK